MLSPYYYGNICAGNYGGMLSTESSAYKEYNHILNKYFTETVQVRREKTKLVNEEVLSELRDILSNIHENDPRFEKEPIFVGSRYQGLMVDIDGDIDVSVVLDLGAKFPWGSYQFDVLTPLPYGFEPIDGYSREQLNKTSSLRKDLQIVSNVNPLPHPGPGYTSINPQGEKFADMLFAGDLIPFKVKQKFRSLLLQARRNLKLNDDYQLSADAHGPAQTMKTYVPTKSKNVHVSMDLAVVIRAGLSFNPEMNWPRKPWWPSPEKVKSIQEKGMNVVAQDPFYWKFSFAELEKDLVRNLDVDTQMQTCRKKVHRIMKSVYYEVCRENPTLSTYMLKNVWLWECENFSDAMLWSEDKLAERYVGCLRSLFRCAQQRILPQYFDNRINLFKGKDTQKIQEDIRKISRFPFDQNTSVHHLVFSV